MKLARVMPPAPAALQVLQQALAIALLLAAMTFGGFAEVRRYPISRLR